MAKVGYWRVSTKEQNEARQLEALKNCDKIFGDKLTGKNRDRKGLNELLDFIREGDVVVVLDLDRIGRNNKDITDIMLEIQNKKATLEVLSLPSFKGVEDPNLRGLLNNLILEIYKYQAQAEIEKTKERQRQGIKIAKEMGVYKGSDKKYTENSKGKNKLVYDTIKQMLANNEPIAKIARETEVSRPTIYKLKQEMKQENEPLESLN